MAKPIGLIERKVGKASQTLGTMMGYPPGPYHYRDTDAPGTGLRFTIETRPARWDRYAIQEPDGDGTRGDWVEGEPDGRPYVRLGTTTDAGREGEAVARLWSKSPELVDVVCRLLGVVNQLMPGIGNIACTDYREINEAPMDARRILIEAGVPAAIIPA